LYDQPIPDDLQIFEALDYQNRSLYSPWSPFQKISLKELKRREAFKEKYGKCWTYQRECDKLEWKEEQQRQLKLDLLHPLQPLDNPPNVGILPPEENWDADGFGQPPTFRHPNRRGG
jgi:hypothetical protein